MRRALAFTVLVLFGSSGFIIGCPSGDGSCPSNKEPGLFLSARPEAVEANGTSAINVVASGLDTSCNPIPAGTMIELHLSNQQPENPNDDPNLVGAFGNGQNGITVASSALGAQTTLTSVVAGTAVVTAAATVDGEYMTALPSQVTFNPPPTDRCAITLTAFPAAIIADGASTTVVTASVTGYDGNAMSDGTEVTFNTTLGVFTSTTEPDTTALIQNGQAEVVLRSELLDQTTVAEVTATYICDDPDRTEKSNQRPVPFSVGGDDPFVTLTGDSNSVLADGNSTVDLTAEVYLPDGTRAPAGEEVNFFTDLGRFQDSGIAAYDTVTDAEGKAYATFIGGISGGLATIRASVYINDRNASDTYSINVRQVGFVEFISATPNKLGVSGSGVNEASAIIFAVRDTNGQAFPDVLVEFTHSVAQGVTLDPLASRTNVDGRVVTNLNSGAVATTVTVTATAIVGDVRLAADSPSLAIVGAKPNARFLTFSCERLNTGGFLLDGVHTTCTVRLADRFSNKVGFATSVTFMTEAGAIEPSAVTEIDGANMGSTEVIITTGEPRPKDVTPMISPAEPYYVDGFYTRNPRDGLLTIIVATTGEEEFSDRNGNGDYDLGEPFVDLGEPFVDYDDNGVRGADEPFIDDGNGLYDGPNGQWDGDTQIWRPYWMVWTGHVASGIACGAPHRYSGLCPDAFFSINTGETQNFTWEAKDFNMNPINESLSVNVTVSGDGSVAGSSPPLQYNAPDALGTAVGLVKLNQNSVAGGLPCTDVDPVCYLLPLVSGFSSGFSGSVTVEGPSTPQMAVPGTINLITNYKETPTEGANISASVPISGEFGF